MSGISQEKNIERSVNANTDFGLKKIMEGGEADRASNVPPPPPPAPPLSLAQGRGSYFV